jgi:hypothetical protein
VHRGAPGDLLGSHAVLAVRLEHLQDPQQPRRPVALALETASFRAAEVVRAAGAQVVRVAGVEVVEVVGHRGLLVSGRAAGP